MTAKSHNRGNEISYDEMKKEWKNNSEEISCSNCGRKAQEVMVKIPADLFHNGKTFWKRAKIDKCIAPIVEALQKGGIDMRGSCCGHGKLQGQIHLQDGRILIIHEDGDKWYKENPMR